MWLLQLVADTDESEHVVSVIIEATHRGVERRRELVFDRVPARLGNKFCPEVLPPFLDQSLKDVRGDKISLHKIMAGAGELR